MPTKTLTQNGTENMGIEAKSEAGYRVLSYSGTLGGGTLQLLTQCGEGADQVPVPDSKLSAANVDGNGDPIRQMVFVSAGNVLVSLTGASAPNCKVSVQ
jgi:hypothetical protein